jgi:hypothetical protein
MNARRLAACALALGIAAGQPPVRLFGMKLTCIGDSDWRAAGPVPPK